MYLRMKCNRCNQIMRRDYWLRWRPMTVWKQLLSRAASVRPALPIKVAPVDLLSTISWVNNTNWYHHGLDN